MSLEFHIRQPETTGTTWGGTGSIRGVAINALAVKPPEGEFFRSEEDMAGVDLLLSQLPDLETVVLNTVEGSVEGIDHTFARVRDKIQQWSYYNSRIYMQDVMEEKGRPSSNQLPVSPRRYVAQ